MTTTAAPVRWYEVPLVPALLMLHLLIEGSWTVLDSVISDAPLAETLGLGVVFLAIEVLFLVLVWRRKRWAWYLVAALSVLGIGWGLAAFAYPDMWGYAEEPSTTSAVALTVLLTASSAVWFAPALRAHVLRRG